MYKIIYLPKAKKDLEEIIYYISHKLKNQTAAVNLIEEFKKQEKNILTFPYGFSIYKNSKKLNHNYRFITAKNFNMFYSIDEENKTITIASIIYNKRNIDKLIK